MSKSSFIITGKEYFYGSGMSHPDVGIAEAKHSYEDQGSRPLAAGDLQGRAASPPALGVIGNAFRRMTLFDAGKLIEYFGDFWLSTQFGATNTDGRKVRVKHIVATDNLVEGYRVRAHDHVIKVSNEVAGYHFQVLLPAVHNLVGIALGIPAECEAYTARGALLDAQADRQFWGRELYIQAEALGLNSTVEIRRGVNANLHGYTWFQSGYDQDEWYLALDDGTTTGLAHSPAHIVLLDAVRQQHSPAGPGTLVAGQYGWGDSDGLGFNTYYIWSATDPNEREVLIGFALEAVLDVAQETVHLVSYWSTTGWEVLWDVVGHYTPSTPSTTLAPTTVATIETDAPTTPNASTVAPTTLSPTTLATQGGTTVAPTTLATTLTTAAPTTVG